MHLENETPDRDNEIERLEAIGVRRIENEPGNTATNGWSWPTPKATNSAFAAAAPA